MANFIFGTEPPLMLKPKPLYLLLLPFTCLLISCSFARKQDVCESNLGCSNNFGPGYQCREDGLCHPATANPSCLEQVPADLLQSPEKYKGYTLIGSLLRDNGKEGARHNAAQLAFDAANEFLESDANTYNELEDLCFGFIQCSHAGEVEEIAALGNYLSNELNVAAIIGPASSSATQATYELLHPQEQLNEGSLIISPSATSVALTELDKSNPGLLYRTAPMDDAQALLMAAAANEKEQPYAVVYEDTAYGRGLYQSLTNLTKRSCNDCGIMFDATSDDVLPLDRALTADSAADALNKAELLFFFGAQETHIKAMIQRFNSEPFANQNFFFSDAAASQDTLKEVEVVDYSRFRGTRASAPSNTAALRLFEALYEAAYGESAFTHSFTAHAYDAAWLVVAAAIDARLKNTLPTGNSLALGMQQFSSSSWSSLSQAACPLSLEKGVCPPLTLNAAELPLLIDGLQQYGQVDVLGASSQLNYCPKEEELERRSESFNIYRLEENDDTKSAELEFRFVDEPVTSVFDAEARCPNE